MMHDSDMEDIETRLNELTERVETLESKIGEKVSQIRDGGDWYAVVTMVSPTGCVVPLDYPVSYWLGEVGHWADEEGEMVSPDTCSHTFWGYIHRSKRDGKLRALKEKWSKEHYDRIGKHDH